MTGWITCQDCQEVEGSVVLCDRHRQMRDTRNTHQFASLDGEDFRCIWCDSHTGSEPCPGTLR